MAEEGMSNTGVVVRFYGRGYGFIKPDGAEVNLFVHHSEIQSDGYRILREGQKVTFLVAEMEDGRTKAVKVTPIDKLNVKRNHKKRSNNSNNNVVGVECYNCGGFAHLARDCSSPVNVTNGRSANDRKCFNCGVLGHIARDCDREVKSSGGECYNCGVVGHMAKDCTSNSGGGTKRSGGGDGSCYNCRQKGHFARECPSAASAR
uniref:cold shock protein 1-like n=1 Tax=Erigeron canadensis TaxID=72917 RepID=UPI001CB8DA79|nr:cold shock protein 1-like [Erigeron canadensis]